MEKGEKKEREEYELYKKSVSSPTLTTSETKQKSISSYYQAYKFGPPLTIKKPSLKPRELLKKMNYNFYKAAGMLGVAVLAAGIMELRDSYRRLQQWKSLRKDVFELLKDIEDRRRQKDASAAAYENKKN